MNKTEAHDWLRSRDWFQYLFDLDLSTANPQEHEAAKRLYRALASVTDENAPPNVTCEPMFIWFHQDGTHTFPFDTTTGKVSDNTGRTLHNGWDGALGPYIADALTGRWGHVMMLHINSGRASNKYPILLVETFKGSVNEGGRRAMRTPNANATDIFKKDPHQYVAWAWETHKKWVADAPTQPTPKSIPGMSFS